MKRGRTALSGPQRFGRALKTLGIRAKRYRRMLKKPGVYIDEIMAVERLAFGTGPSRRQSVLLVPELRKRRSERNPEVLAQQKRDASIRLADIKAGRVSAG